MLTEHLQPIDQIDLDIILRLFEKQQNQAYQRQCHNDPAEPFIIIREKEGNC